MRDRFDAEIDVRNQQLRTCERKSRRRAQENLRICWILGRDVLGPLQL